MGRFGRSRKGNREERSAMRAYRFYLLDCRDAIAAVEVWDTDRRIYINVVGVEAAE
jgi:hypothetical protein